MHIQDASSISHNDIGHVNPPLALPKPHMALIINLRGSLRITTDRKEADPGSDMSVHHQ